MRARQWLPLTLLDRTTCSTGRRSGRCYRNVREASARVASVGHESAGLKMQNRVTE